MATIKFNKGVFKTKNKKLALAMMEFQRVNKKEIKKVEKMSGIKISK